MSTIERPPLRKRGGDASSRAFLGVITILGVLAASLVPLAAQADVPVPTPTQAIISVNVGGTRLPDGSVKGVAGVRLSLYRAGTATTNTNPVVQGLMGTRYDPSWSWTTCVSDAAGDCNFVIPVSTVSTGTATATSVPQNTRFWVAQAPTDTSPSGWYANPSLRVGSFAASPEYSWGYRFRTGAALVPGGVYRSTTPMTTARVWSDPDAGFLRTRDDDNAEGSFAPNIGRTAGIWSQSRTNPPLPAQCGLDVALIVDTSGSLGAAGMAEEIATMNTFVNAFRGTPTRMSLFSFSRVSPGTGASNHPTLLPVTTASQAATFSRSTRTGSPVAAPTGTAVSPRRPRPPTRMTSPCSSPTATRR